MVPVRSRRADWFIPRDAGASLAQKPVLRLLASHRLGQSHGQETRTLAQRLLPLAPVGGALRNALADRIVQTHRQFGSPGAEVSQRDRALLRARSQLP